MDSPAQQLATAVASDQARRTARWRLRFRITWGAIVALLVLFIAVSLNVDRKSTRLNSSH